MSRYRSIFRCSRTITNMQYILKMCVCVCPNHNSAYQNVMYTHIIYKYTHGDPRNAVDFTHIIGVVSQAKWYCTIAKVKHHRSKRYPSIVWDLCFNLNKTICIYFEVYCTLRPFLWIILGPYTKTLHAPWGMRGLGKPHNKGQCCLVETGIWKQETHSYE